VVDGTACVIDCSSGMARWTVEAGRSFDAIRDTHQQCGHDTDYGDLSFLA
jgi:hypothetical protein